MCKMMKEKIKYKKYLIFSQHIFLNEYKIINGRCENIIIRVCNLCHR